MIQPSISIIVPVYNVEPYVEDSIRSVMRQTYEGPMECIIVDDCGTDNSMDIVEKLVADYNGPISFNILHHEHNRGLSAARNTGMDVAKGGYLFFLDSDDELSDDCIEILTEPLKTECFDVVMGNVRCFKTLSSGEKESIKNHLELSISKDMPLDSSMMMRTIYQWKNMTAWNRLFRTYFIRQNHLHFKEGLLYEDQLWSFQIACLASSFYVSSNITYHYRWREGSIAHPYDNQKYIKNLQIAIKEMSHFVYNFHIKKEGVWEVLKMFFTAILKNHSTSISEYVSTYKEFRPYVKVPIKYLVIVLFSRPKVFLYDLHFMMPQSIAPYWQYIIMYILHKI